MREHGVAERGTVANHMIEGVKISSSVAHYADYVGEQSGLSDFYEFGL